MGLKTTSHHVAEALRFYNAASKYFAIGRSTAWPNESSPPAEDPDAVAVEEVIGYAPTYQVKLLKQDVGGSFTYNGTNYTEVTPANAYTEEATFVYVDARVVGNELPLTTFRQYGLFTGLVPAQGAPAGVLLPNQVSSPGVLEALKNRAAVARYADKTDVPTFLFSF